MYIDRQQIVEELRLRRLIRKAIHIVESKRARGNKEAIAEDSRIQSVISSLMAEAGAEVGDVQDSPHQSTGINVLEDLLKKVIPVIEIDYKKMTTSDEQRASYVSHMLKAVENTLAPLKTNDTALDEQDVNIDIKDEEPEEFIDVRGEKEDPTPDEQEKETFSIEGSDMTGRDMAFDTFKKVETNIIDSYEVLSNPEDKSIFYDYLLKNLNLYFEKFEDELKPKVDMDATPLDQDPSLDTAPAQEEDELDLADIANL
tara:strand:- start:699 stop:1469 length:771 start_codon:yes stop_codon:yes gene_type:complete